MVNEQSSAYSSVLTNKTIEIANKTIELAKNTADGLSSSLTENFVNTMIDIYKTQLHTVSIGLNIVSEGISFAGNKTMLFLDNYVYQPIAYYTPNPMDYHFFVHKSQLKDSSTVDSSLTNTAIKANNHNSQSTIDTTSKNVTDNSTTVSSISKNTNNVNLENSDSNLKLSENSFNTNLSTSDYELGNPIPAKTGSSLLEMESNSLPNILQL